MRLRVDFGVRLIKRLFSRRGTGHSKLEISHLFQPLCFLLIPSPLVKPEPWKWESLQ
ncbi:asr2757 [Nostoc sp. PCC 7120 = FACHB-418]|nr:asr2757 [Nostoc sp. PCC 7120 = FACHB-418]